MAREDRLEAARKKQVDRVPPDNRSKTIQSFKFVDRLVVRVKRQLESFMDQFDRLSGDTVEEKRTAYFQHTVSEMSIEFLHDLAQLMDAQFSFVNSYRRPGVVELVQPFSDANVDYFEANGVSN